MTTKPNPTILSVFKLIRATFLESNRWITKHLEMMVQVTLPLLVAFREEPIEVHEHVLVHVLQIVVCLQCNKYFESISNKRQ